MLSKKVKMMIFELFLGQFSQKNDPNHFIKISDKVMYQIKHSKSCF
jgi:hypothetical protein